MRVWIARWMAALAVLATAQGNAGSGIQRVDLRTGKVSSVAQVFRQNMIDLGPIDAREAYAMMGEDIIAYDFRSQKTRTVVPGHLTVQSPYPTNEPPFALDARYFYFGQQFGGVRTQPGTGMYRVRRDGSGQPELLGIPPAPGHYGGAILDGGFFYYRGGSRKTGLTIVRRRVEKGSSEQTLVTLKTWHGCTSAVLGETFCWGRGDAFQLGFLPPDTCQVGAERVPCSRSAHAMTLSLPQGTGRAREQPRQPDPSVARRSRCAKIPLHPDPPQHISSPRLREARARARHTYAIALNARGPQTSRLWNVSRYERRWTGRTSAASSSRRRYPMSDKLLLSTSRREILAPAAPHYKRNGQK